MLETVDLSLSLDRKTYVDQLTRRQIQLRELGYQVYVQKRPVVRLGRRRQGRQHQAPYREAGPARLRRLSHQRSGRRRQDAPLPVPVLAPAARARPDRRL